VSALILMVMSPQLGIGSFTVLALLLLVMGLNLVCMLAAISILSFLKPITLLILGFILGVIQLALEVELIVSGIEIEVLVLQRLLKVN
jgi:multiple antibiotic resistance protein